ncbi:MAG: hypothetical protein N4J56_007409 [Chroococcidiopsis sp. SAG 2025]|nr:hypothetical protein [Chroococcidiopsis sp. SAG 2025]
MIEGMENRSQQGDGHWNVLCLNLPSYLLPLRQLPLGAEPFAACPYGNTSAYCGMNLPPNNHRHHKQHRGVFELLLV